MDEATEFGLKDGFSVPILGAEGDRSCVTMGGAKLDIPPRGREVIYVISLCAHQRARRCGAIGSGARTARGAARSKEARC